MSTPPFRGWTSPNYAFDKRRGQVQRGLAQQVQNYDQVGNATVNLPAGSGLLTSESTFNVSFSFSFVEKPLFTCGSELGPNQGATSGMFPSLSATVHHWLTTPAGYSTLYTGAVVGVVASGPGGMQIICHYSFRAKAQSSFAQAFNDTGVA